MEVLALSVSEPKIVVHGGREISTGIYKTQVDGPRMVRKSNIDGDRQADLTVHGGFDKAVYAFPREHYAFYQETLGKGPYDFGQFGENLTVTGLLENEVKIGDRFRIGEALLEVSEPRLPCFKFAIKMESDIAVRACVTSKKTGFYLRVLEEGMIEAGNAIEPAGSEDGAPSVMDIVNLYFFDRKNVEAMKQAAECKALAKSWSDYYVEILAKRGA